MPDSQKVTAGRPKVGGAVFSATLAAGLVIPTDASTALTSDFNDLGYVSEDGVTQTLSNDTTDVKEWGGSTVLSIEDNFADEWKMKLIEATNADVLKEVFGQNAVTVDASGHITIAASAVGRDYRCYVVDMLLRNGGIRRVVLPNAKISAVEDITHGAKDAVGYGVTLKCAPDASGKTHYEYIEPAA